MNWTKVGEKMVMSFAIMTAISVAAIMFVLIWSLSPFWASLIFMFLLSTFVFSVIVEYRASKKWDGGY